MSQQLMSYLMSDSILSETQHGFRPGRSAETVVLAAVGYLMSGPEIQGGSEKTDTFCLHLETLCL